MGAFFGRRLEISQDQIEREKRKLDGMKFEEVKNVSVLAFDQTRKLIALLRNKIAAKLSVTTQ